MKEGYMASCLKCVVALRRKFPEVNLFVVFLIGSKLHHSESHLFPAKPLRDSQSHLLTDTQSWTEISANTEKGKVGKNLFYVITISFIVNSFWWV